MKFFKITKLIVITMLVISILSFKTSKANIKKEDLQKIWADLFSKNQGSNCKDRVTNPLIDPLNNLILDFNGVPWSGPRKKTNILDKHQGFGPSAYLFDYIDQILQSDVAKEFQTIYDAVKILVPDEKNFKEPYPLSQLVGAYSPNEPSTNSTNSTDPNDQILLDKLKAIMGKDSKVFNENAYKAGITVGNIYQACKNFQWNYNPQESNFAKKIVDTYDFDGDGRLNPREFIIMSIVHNKNIIGTTCQQCFNDTIIKKIDPIFKFLDCNNDGKINAEDMWINLENLKRNSTNNNIYDCTIKGKKYRTNSMNDFIIKNMKSFDGYLTKEEFRSAILLGYWDRQTDVEKIIPDDTRTFKQLRWGPSNDTDVVCQRILTANNPPAAISKQATISHSAANGNNTSKSSYYFN